MIVLRVLRRIRISTAFDRVATIGLLVLTAACGGGDTPTSSASSGATAGGVSRMVLALEVQSPKIGVQASPRMRPLAAVGPSSAVPAVAAGMFHSLALKSDGTVWAWGFGGQGQLGINSTTNSSVPVQVVGAAGIGVFTGVTAISAGDQHSLALKGDGTVWAWGDDEFGKLGHNGLGSSAVPVQVVGAGGAGVLTSVTAVAAGNLYSLVLKSDGTVWAWGLHGELHNIGNVSSSTPVQVAGAGGTGVLTGVTAIAAGRAHSLALKSDGTVWAWGNGNFGQLGNNGTASSRVPVQVVGAGGTGVLSGVTAIAAGTVHSLALRNDGTIWAWGEGIAGQLGNGGIASSSVPVQVAGAGGTGVWSGVTAIAAGDQTSLALRSGGTVWAWGHGLEGSLGNNSTASTSVPVQVVGPGGTGALTAVTTIASGMRHPLALKSDGTVWAWGRGLNGELGNNSTANSSVPVQVVGPGGVGFLNLGVGTPAYYSLIDLTGDLTIASQTLPTGIHLAPLFLDNDGLIIGQMLATGPLGLSGQGFALPSAPRSAPVFFCGTPSARADSNLLAAHFATVSVGYVQVGPVPSGCTAFATTYLLPTTNLDALSVNNLQQAVGTYWAPGTGEGGAALFANGQVTFLSSPLGLIVREARGINDQGTIVGWASAMNCTAACGRPVLFSGGTWQDLSPLVGIGGAANGINNLGQIIGTTILGGSENTAAWVLNGHVKVDIPPLSVGDAMIPERINSFGVVKGFQQLGVAEQRQFVYFDGASYDINSLIEQGAGWRILRVLDLNDRGQLIGFARAADGSVRYVRLDPTGANPFPRTGSAPAISLTPVSLDFGSVSVGSAKNLVLTVINSGTGTLTGTASGSGTFGVIAGAALNLSAGQSQDVTVRFAPVAAGVAASQLLISTNAGNRAVPLSGTGSSAPPPASCASQAVSWTVDTSRCTATYPGGQNGTSAALSDIIAPDTGTVTASCTSGQLTLTAPVCVTAPPPPPPAACASQVVPWTVGTSSCSATYSGGQSGSSTSLSDIITPDTGTVTASCTNGQLMLTLPVCVTAPPPPPADCANQAVLWTVGTSTCTATYSGGQSGSSTTLSDIIAPDTGTVTASCTNGLLLKTALACSTAPPPPPPPSVILSAFPQSGTTGTPVKIIGSNLGFDGTVKFGSAEAVIYSWKTTSGQNAEIVAIAPDGVIGSVPITVTTSGGNFAIGPFFSYSAESGKCTDFLALMNERCTLLSKLRSPNYYAISRSQISDDLLYAYIEQRKTFINVLIAQIDFGNDLVRFLRHESNNLDSTEPTFDKLVSKASEISPLLESFTRILRIYYPDSVALAVSSQFLAVIGIASEGYNVYQLGVKAVTTRWKREMLREYFFVRCGAYGGAASCPKAFQEASKEYAFQQTKELMPTDDLGVLLGKTKVPLALVEEYCESAFMPYRLTAYGDSSQVRRQQGETLARSVLDGVIR